MPNDHHVGKDRRILILGGTAEARVLAGRLLTNGCSVVSSLAGVTENPMLPDGEVRMGGFGGVDGLVDYLSSANINLLIDATHPFAAIMSQHAHAAAQFLSLPLLRLERPIWQAQAGEHWTHAIDMARAVELLPDNAKVFVTTGRKNLRLLFGRGDLRGLIRSIEAPAENLPQNWQLLQDRPPHLAADEAALMKQHGITHLLTKNAGGASTYGKIVAARELGVSLVMIDRPLKPVCPTSFTIDALIDAVDQRFA